MRGPLTKAVTGTLGFASEAIAAVRTKSNEKNAPPDLERKTSSGSIAESDEDDQVLDEAQLQLQGNIAEEDIKDLDKFVDSFAMRHPPPTYEATKRPLDYPVIIPQRRPRHKSRGFVRAYAPALNDCGIDQNTFMDFLNGFDAAIKKQALFIAVNMAVGTTVLATTSVFGNNPGITIGAALVHTSVEVGRRMYIARKINTYLYEMNEKAFKPRGLYAMIMVYRPESQEAGEVVDLQSNIVKSVSTRNAGPGPKFSIKSASGTTHGEAQMPLTSPLVFPMLQSASEQQQEAAFKKAAAFFGDYGDRRAQARFQAQNPDSSLNLQPQHKFASRWSDPNHPVNTGGPLAVLTGGHFSPDNNRRARRQREEQARKEAVLAAGQTYTPKKQGGMKKFLNEEVLYLMIVNMPSEEELAAVAALELKN